MRKLTLLLAICLLFSGCCYKCNFIKTDVPGDGAKVSTSNTTNNPIVVTPSVNAGDEAIKTGGEVAEKITPTGAASGAVSDVVGK